MCFNKLKKFLNVAKNSSQTGFATSDYFLPLCTTRSNSIHVYMSYSQLHTHQKFHHLLPFRVNKSLNNSILFLLHQFFMVSISFSHSEKPGTTFTTFWLTIRNIDINHRRSWHTFGITLILLVGSIFLCFSPKLLSIFLCFPENSYQLEPLSYQDESPTRKSI